jgi:hypothetical protein
MYVGVCARVSTVALTRDELRLRREIFEAFAATAEPPEVPASDALAELERRHVVALRDGRVLMAHPFAAHRDGTRVSVPDGREWWGNCAWDGLGIVAALGLRDAVVDSGGVLLRVEDGSLVSEGMFHVAVPAARWWDDIEFT